MENRYRLALAIARVNDAFLEQRHHIIDFKKSLSDLERQMKSIERGLHGYAATMARVKREIEHVGREARTLQRIMAAAERGQVPESLDDETPITDRPAAYLFPVRSGHPGRNQHEEDARLTGRWKWRRPARLDQGF